MKKEKIFLFIILIFILVEGCSERKKEEVTSLVDEEPFEEEVKKVNMKEKNRVDKIIFSSRRNPFLMWEEEKKFAQKKIREVIDYLDLTAIFYSPSKSFAVIEGHVVEEGDMIAGKRIVKINPKAVILEDEKGEYILPLKEK